MSKHNQKRKNSAFNSIVLYSCGIFVGKGIFHLFLVFCVVGNSVILSLYSLLAQTVDCEHGVRAKCRFCLFSHLFRDFYFTKGNFVCISGRIGVARFAYESKMIPFLRSAKRVNE